MDAKARFVSLASSSRGNCHILSVAGRAVVIDCGISLRRLRAGMSRLGLTTSDISFVLVSHNHVDHVSGIGSLSRTFGPTVCGPASVKGRTGGNGAGFVALTAGDNTIDGARIHAFPLSHDANPTFGYRLETGGVTAAFVNDLGFWDEQTLSAIEDVDLLLWEANHDEGMLFAGRYSERLKARIAGIRGHLSNRQSVEGIAMLDKLPRRLVVGHLSLENNSVERVVDAFEEAHLDRHMSIAVLDPRLTGEVLEIQ